MDDFDFYGGADTWHTVFSLPAPQSTAFYFKALPAPLKNRAKNFQEERKSPSNHKMFPECHFLETTVICNHDS